MATELILIVEDELDLQELLRFNLESEGYRTIAAGSGQRALALIESASPDLVVLDLNLPGPDGLEVCQAVRRSPRSRTIPILMLTARIEDSDIIAGLEVGADDYVTKPFSPSVLLARIKAALRRVRETSPEKSLQGVLIRGAISLHPGRREVSRDGVAISLTKTEFRILHLLMRRPGWVFSRNQIVDEVRGDSYAVTERAVDVQMVGLRRKMGPAGRCIETVRGEGYRFREK